jgi:DNA-binding GntR family transcriptional regulator
MIAEKPPHNPSGKDTYLRIVADIRSGAILPGDRLTETELAARFGVSRTPVREAIRQLEADGLVSHTPRVGATLRKLDYAEVSELYEMRSVLESTAARFAARAASDVELGELCQLHNAMRSTDDALSRAQLNFQFHQALLDAARNRFLLQAAQSISNTLLILGTSTMREDERAIEANAEHGQILAALQARDPDTAESTMRLHIEAAHRARLRLLRTAHSQEIINP